MHNENKPLLALMFLPTMKEMLITGNAQKPHLVNPIRRGTLSQEEEKKFVWKGGRNEGHEEGSEPNF